MKRFLTSLSSVALLVATIAFGGEGTLPFGKGQVPFDMAGQALEGTQADSLLLRFEPKPLTIITRESIPCPEGLTLYDFSGTITLKGLSYEVTAICADGLGDGVRLVRGTRGTASITLEGELMTESLGFQTFTGTATVERSSTIRTYDFSVSE